MPDTNAAHLLFIPHPIQLNKTPNPTKRICGATKTPAKPTPNASAPFEDEDIPLKK